MGLILWYIIPESPEEVWGVLGDRSMQNGTTSQLARLLRFPSPITEVSEHPFPGGMEGQTSKPTACEEEAPRGVVRTWRMCTVLYKHYNIKGLFLPITIAHVTFTCPVSLLTAHKLRLNYYRRVRPSITPETRHRANSVRINVTFDADIAQ